MKFYTNKLYLCRAVTAKFKCDSLIKRKVLHQPDGSHFLLASREGKLNCRRSSINGRAVNRRHWRQKYLNQLANKMKVIEVLFPRLLIGCNKKCKLCGTFRGNYAARKDYVQQIMQFLLSYLKLVLLGFKWRKSLLCYSKDNQKVKCSLQTCCLPWIYCSITGTKNRGS